MFTACLIRIRYLHCNIFAIIFKGQSYNRDPPAMQSFMQLQFIYLNTFTCTCTARCVLGFICPLVDIISITDSF